jgi:hypothetical protein
MELGRLGPVSGLVGGGENISLIHRVVIRPAALVVEPLDHEAVTEPVRGLTKRICVDGELDGPRKDFGKLIGRRLEPDRLKGVHVANIVKMEDLAHRAGPRRNLETDAAAAEMDPAPLRPDVRGGFGRENFRQRPGFEWGFGRIMVEADYRPGAIGDAAGIIIANDIVSTFLPPHCVGDMKGELRDHRREDAGDVHLPLHAQNAPHALILAGCLDREISGSGRRIGPFGRIRFGLAELAQPDLDADSRRPVDLGGESLQLVVPGVFQ